MNIHEHQAKEILKEFGAPVSKGVVIYSINEIREKISNLSSKEFVLKAQIHAGGRGKAGGVKLVKNISDLEKEAKLMMGKVLITHQTGPEGKQVKRLYIEEASEIYKEFSEMSPETDIEILTMSIAQNAYVLNKKLKDLKLARSKTEVAFLLKQGVNCIWCPTDLYRFSKNDVFLNKEFALSMACHLTKDLLMKKIYLFRQDKLADVLTEGMRNIGVTVEYC